MIAPLLGSADLERLRTALERYTADDVADLLGPIGRAAHEHGDLTGVARAVRATGDAGPTTTFVRLFLLGDDVPDRDAAAALGPLPLEAAVGAGIVVRAGDRVRAGLELRPYAEAGTDERWWVVSDLGSDVRPGPLDPEHVLGVGNAALTLAQATPRSSVDRALDVGTGCGVQALHLARHAGHVTATDVSTRALRYAATTAALSGQDWALRQGSFLDPVADQSFDLIVANPPFVVSPGRTGAGVDAEAGAEYTYRDSGLAGDAVCRDLVRAMVPRLAPGGTGQLLANWIVPTDGTWQERVGAWFPPGCRAWVWQREVADLGEYVTMWLRDAGLRPNSHGWAPRYDAWLDWFAAHDVAAVGMGLITLRRGTDPSDRSTADVIAEDVPQPVTPPIGAEVVAWFERRPIVTAVPDEELLRRRFSPATDLVRERHDLLDGPEGWATRRATLRLARGMRWEVEVDDAVARIVAACAAGAPPMTALEVLAATSGDDLLDLARRFAPVLRDLVSRGLLLPGDGTDDGRT